MVSVSHTDDGLSMLTSWSNKRSSMHRSKCMSAYKMSLIVIALVVNAGWVDLSRGQLLQRHLIN